MSFSKKFLEETNKISSMLDPNIIDAMAKELN